MSKILLSAVVCFVILGHIHVSNAVERSPRPELEKHDFDDTVSPLYKSPAERSNQENNSAEVDSSEKIREPETSETRENVAQESLDRNSDPENIANWELKRLLQYFVVLLHSVKGNNSRYKEEYTRVRNEGMPNSRRIKLKTNGPQKTNGKYKDGERNEFDLKQETSTRLYETDQGFNNGDKSSRLKVIEDRKTNVNTKPELNNQGTISEPQGKIKNGYDVMIPNTFESKNTSINNSPIKSDHVTSEFIDDYINYPPTNVAGAENETSTTTKSSYPDETKHEMKRKLNDPLTFKNFSRLKLNNGPIFMNETTDRNNKSNLTKMPYQQHIQQHIPKSIIFNQPKQANLNEQSKIPRYSNNNRSPSHQNKVFIINPNNPKTFYNNANSPEEMKLTQSKDMPNQNGPINVLDKSSENSSVLHDPLKSPFMKENEQSTPKTNILPQEKSSKIDEQISPYTFSNPEDLSKLERNPKEETAQNVPNLFIDMKLDQTKDMPTQNGHTNVHDRSPENSPIFDHSTKNPSKDESKQLRPQNDLPPKEESSKIDEQIPQYTFNSPENINLDRNNNLNKETALNNPHSPMERKLAQDKDMSNRNVSLNILDRNPQNSTVLDDSPKYPSTRENEQLKPGIDLLPQEESSKINEQIHQHAFNNPQDRTNLEISNDPEEETTKNNPNPTMGTKLTQAKDMSNRNAPRNVIDRGPENSSVLDNSPKYPQNKNKQLRQTGVLPLEKSSKIDEQISEYNKPENVTDSERYKPEEDPAKNDLTESDIFPTDSPNTITATEQFSATLVNYPFSIERKMSTTPSESESENTESYIDTSFDENSDSEESEEEDDVYEDMVENISNIKDSGEQIESNSPKMSQISSEPFNNTVKIELPKHFANENRDDNDLPTQEKNSGEEVENKSPQMSQISPEPFTSKSMKMELPKNFRNENRDNNVLPTQGTDSGEVETKSPQMSQISPEPNTSKSMKMELPKNFKKENIDDDVLPTQGTDFVEVETKPPQMSQISTEPFTNNSMKMQLPKHFANENKDDDDLPTQEEDPGEEVETRSPQMSQISSEPITNNYMKTELSKNFINENRDNNVLTTQETDPGEVENKPPEMSEISSEPFTTNSVKMEVPKNFRNENRHNYVLPTEETDSGGNVQSEISQMSQISSEPHIKNSMKTETPENLEKETKTNDTLSTERKYNTILEFLYQHSNNPAFTNMKKLRNIAYN